MSYTCARILREHWYEFECKEPAVVVYELPDGSKAAWCALHRADAERHALLRGWKRVDDPQAVAA